MVHDALKMKIEWKNHYLALNGTRGAAVVVPGAFETVDFVARTKRNDHKSNKCSNKVKID